MGPLSHGYLLEPFLEPWVTFGNLFERENRGWLAMAAAVEDPYTTEKSADLKNVTNCDNAPIALVITTTDLKKKCQTARRGHHKKVIHTALFKALLSFPPSILG